MKRTSNLFGAFLLLLTACSKSEVANPNGGNSSTPPPSPTLSLKADTALYNGSATITITSNAQSVTNLNTNQIVTSQVLVQNLTKDSLVSFIAKNTSGNLSSSTTASITVKCWSARTTQLNNYGQIHMTLNRGCIAGTENLPNPTWIPGIPDLSLYEFFANGSARVVKGPDWPVPGQIFNYPPGSWYWTSPNEEAINFGAGDVWNITLLANGFKRTQVKNGYYTEQIYEK